MRIEGVSPARAQGRVKAVYAEIAQAFPLIPRVFQAFAPHPPLLEAAWDLHRAAMLSGSLDRGLKEAIAVEVSRSNACAYCVDAHTMMLHALGLRGGEAALSAMEDPGDRAQLLPFARDLASRPEQVTPARAVEARAAAGGEGEFIEAVAVIAEFTLVNRVVNVLQIAFDLPAPLQSTALTKRLGMALAALRTRMRVDFTPRAFDAGPTAESLAAVKETFAKHADAPLPTGAERLAARPALLAAYARWAHTVYEDPILPPGMAQLIERATADAEHLPAFASTPPGGAPADLPSRRDHMPGAEQLWSVLDLSRKVAADSSRTPDAPFDRLRREGVTDMEILAVIAAAAFFSAAHRIEAALAPGV